MNITKQIEKQRASIGRNESAIGQYFTPQQVAKFMASLFKNIGREVRLLDPGCGMGALTAAFIDEALKRKKLQKIDITSYDTDESMTQHINNNLVLFQKLLLNKGIQINSTFFKEDFIHQACNDIKQGLASRFTHVVMNPPYKKISSKSEHRQAMSRIGVETVNLYSGFVCLAIDLLEDDGELVAIIPRSFCNGPYYKPFREKILNETSIQQIHIFDSRTDAFNVDGVLQENIILHLIKGQPQKEVIISSSLDAKFYETKNGCIKHNKFLSRQLAFEQIVKEKDEDKFIYITPNETDLLIFEKMANFKTRLKDLDLQVSTGPVVDFRLKADLLDNIEEGAVPLLYPFHLNGKVNWPKVSKKANAIKISPNSKRWLWKNQGYFVLVRRFSSKEEKKRIHASLYDGALEGNFIGFENKLNVFHFKKNGMDSQIAKGLYIYLNSSLLDAFFRLFSGHTQVNATDLRNIPYPSKKQLITLGTKTIEELKQSEIDQLIENLL